MTFPIHVTAFAAVPSVPLLLHVVIVHHAVLQFLLPFAFTQNVIPATQPGAYVRVAVTTAFVAKAVLLPVLASPGLEIETLKVTFPHPEAGSGITGMRRVSDAKLAIVVVFVQVTVVPAIAQHDQPLSTKGLEGPDILAGIVRITVCTPLDVNIPALVIVIGN